ncbi:MAG: hypothetical protein R3255_05865 [Candidatus Lokiarchaeia archaeon]|nr:hypothetical protein [Candidatus Lokiarchaeia archaeon]
MTNSPNFILFDSLKGIQTNGKFNGSIISKWQDKVIFSDNITVSDLEGINISEGLLVGFDKNEKRYIPISRSSDFKWNMNENPLEYAILIPESTMEQYDKGQFSNDFPFTINLLHTAALYINDLKNGVNHLDFFTGEILKNPISMIRNGIIVADRLVIDDYGDAVFYDCLIVGRDENDDLKISYEPLVNVDDKVVEYIIILGIEELKI